MDIGNSVWNESDDANNSPAPDGAPEGMAPSGINNLIRADRGAIKRWYNWSSPKTTGGTDTAYTLTYSVAPGALVDGMTHLVQFHTANGASPTLNVNSLGAKPLHIMKPAGWGVLPASAFIIGMVVRVAYHSSSGAYPKSRLTCSTDAPDPLFRIDPSRINLSDDGHLAQPGT